MSCRIRQPVVTATTSKGYKKKTYNFCKECQNLHTFSPDFPGEYLTYENLPKSGSYTSPTYSSHSRYVYQQLEKCQSCQIHYDKDFTTTMSYECLSHSFTFCLNCARLHRICPNDFSVATLDAVTSFVEKFKQNGLDQ